MCSLVVYKNSHVRNFAAEVRKRTVIAVLIITCIVHVYKLLFHASADNLLNSAV